MKKIYSILGLFILSLAYSTGISAQTCAPGSSIGFLKGNTFPGATNCYIEIYAPAAWIGASIDAYNGAGDKVSGATPVWTTASGFYGAYGKVGFQCDQLETITSLELKLNGNVCEVEIGQRAALPIKLSAFNASIKASAVVLSWTSEVESGSSHFGVEKSADGKNFETIGTIKAAGISNAPLKYSFEDNNFTGTSFYRLKLADLDGKVEYSKVVYVNGGAAGSTTLSVFPNPFRSDVQLKGINASDVNKNNIRVFNAAGKEVNFRVSGSNSIAIDATLPQGVYILRVKDQSYKLFKN